MLGFSSSPDTLIIITGRNHLDVFIVEDGARENRLTPLVEPPRATLSTLLFDGIVLVHELISL
ncbi:hypothetical protein AMI01nite_56460 [Aneurinibacillus migulanus]|nr:hypothetical protein AMI01nite_56460 [Aneurinibacillus migulanus]